MLNNIKRWRTVKTKTPVIGIDDGGFDRYSRNDIDIPIFGVIMKGSAYVDGVIQCQIKRDDPNATTKVAAMILESVHKPQLQAIFLQGITIGGFGVLDIVSLWDLTKIPVIVVLRKYPDYPKIEIALEKVFLDHKKRWESIKQAGDPIEIQKEPLILVQAAGIHLKDAILLIKKCTAIGTIPESLRIAHFIGTSYYRSLNQ